VCEVCEHPSDQCDGDEISEKELDWLKKEKIKILIGSYYRGSVALV